MTAAPDIAEAKRARTEARRSKAEWKRVQREIEEERRIAQAQCRSMGHDWLVGLNPVTYCPKERICRRCLRRERPLTLWLKR